MKYLYILLFFMGNVHACNVADNKPYNFYYEYDAKKGQIFYQIKADKEMKYFNNFTNRGEISNIESFKVINSINGINYSKLGNLSNKSFLSSKIISNSFSLKKLIEYYTNQSSDFRNITGEQIIVVRTTIELENNQCLIFETSPIKYNFITKYQHNISATLDTIIAPIFEGDRSLKQKK